MTRKTSDFLSQKRQGTWFATSAALLFTGPSGQETNFFRRNGLVSGAAHLDGSGTAITKTSPILI